MDNNQLYTIISRNIEENSSNYSSNEIFGLLSILLLLEITEIFQVNQAQLREKGQSHPGPAGINNPANLISLLSQLQGSGEGSNLKQVLPLLLAALGTNKGNLDLGQISELLSSLKGKTEKDTAEEIRLIEEGDEDIGEESKKKSPGDKET